MIVIALKWDSNQEIKDVEMPLHRHVSGIHWTHRLFVCSGLCLFACLLVCQLLCFGFTFGRLSSQGESACFQPFCTTACKFIFFIMLNRALKAQVTLSSRKK